MRAGSFIDVLALMTTVAMVYVLVSNKNTAPTITAAANGLAGAFKAITGQK